MLHAGYFPIIAPDLHSPGIAGLPQGYSPLYFIYDIKLEKLTQYLVKFICNSILFSGSVWIEFSQFTPDARLSVIGA